MLELTTRQKHLHKLLVEVPGIKLCRSELATWKRVKLIVSDAPRYRLLSQPTPDDIRTLSGLFYCAVTKKFYIKKNLHIYNRIEPKEVVYDQTRRVTTAS